MNIIKKVNKANILQIMKKFKSSRIYQPGLSRFEWDAQNYDPEPYEVFNSLRFSDQESPMVPMQKS